MLAQDIARRELSAEESAAKIEAFRNSYRPIARHSSFLYRCLTDLSNLNAMYQYSLGWFVRLYIIAIEGR
jgi:dynein heavy chain